MTDHAMATYRAMESTDSDSSNHASERKRVKISKRYCPHCKEILSYKTYRAHKRIYYESCRSLWHTRDESLGRRSPSPGQASSPSYVSVVSQSPTSASSDESPPNSQLDSFDACDNDCVASDSHDTTSYFGRLVVSGKNCIKPFFYFSLTIDEESEVWSDSDHPENDFDEEPPNSQPLEEDAQEPTRQKALATWLTISLLFLQVRYRLTEKLLLVLFKLFKIIMQILGRFNPFCAGVSDVLPGNFYQALSRYGLNKEHFKRFVVCKKCHRVYYMRECIARCGTQVTTKPCSYLGLEKHVCGTPLLKNVELLSGRKIFTPFLTYCYVDLKTSMEYLLSCSEFVESSMDWRCHASLDHGILKSVFDGKMWNDFLCYDSTPFLQDPYNYGLILNLDWFQPYKHLSYSVGVLYLSVLNLPSHLRYKDTYTIIIGVLPGPHEPKLTVNSYMEPLVNDLLAFWSGVSLHVHGVGEKKVRHVVF